MTMILAAVGSGAAVMVSDRLTSRVWPSGRFAGQHDTAANKNVVYLTRSAAAILGYTGTAYLEGRPSDEWIARELAEQDFMLGPDNATFATTLGGPRIKRSLNSVFFGLRKRLAAVAGGHGVTVLACGWRRRRHRSIPILVRLRAASAPGPDPQMRMRPRPRVAFGDGVGALPPIGTFQAALAGSPMEAAEYFARTIRATATTNQTVGPHLMAVLMTPGSVECQFVAEAEHYISFSSGAGTVEVPVAYSPWIVGDGGYSPPQLIVGGDVVLNHPGWKITLKATAAPPSAGGPVAMSRPQPRMRAR